MIQWLRIFMYWYVSFICTFFQIQSKVHLNLTCKKSSSNNNNIGIFCKHNCFIINFWHSSTVEQIYIVSILMIAGWQISWSSTIWRINSFLVSCCDFFSPNLGNIYDFIKLALNWNSEALFLLFFKKVFHFLGKIALSVTFFQDPKHVFGMLSTSSYFRDKYPKLHQDSSTLKYMN